MQKAPWYALEVNGTLHTETLYTNEASAALVASLYRLANVKIVEVDFNGNRV